MNSQRQALTDAQVQAAALPGESWEDARFRLEDFAKRSRPRLMRPCVNNPHVCNGWLHEIQLRVCDGCDDDALQADEFEQALLDEELNRLARHMPKN